MLPDFEFHHIGVAVFDIGNCASLYTGAGYAGTDTVYDPVQNVRICFLEKEGMPRIELVEPHDGKSPVTNILKKNGVGPYHMCYTVKDIDDSVSRLRKMGFIPVTRPVGAVAMGGNRICFLFNKNTGLIELVEKK